MTRMREITFEFKGVWFPPTQLVTQFNIKLLPITNYGGLINEIKILS